MSTLIASHIGVCIGWAISWGVGDMGVAKRVICRVRGFFLRYFRRGTHATSVIDNLKLYKKLEETNRSLEMQVLYRTLALEECSDQLKQSLYQAEQSRLALAETKQQLIQSEKMSSLGALVAGVAHEINNPVSYTQITAKNIREDLLEFRELLFDLAGDSADARVLSEFDTRFEKLFKQTGRISDGMERISAIVTDLRSFSVQDNTGGVIVDLTAEIIKTVNLVKANFKDAVSFELLLNSTQRLHCRPKRLNQVFMNITVNACQSIVEKNRRLRAFECEDGHSNSVNNQDGVGHLRVSTWTEGNNYIIEFSDTGLGIDSKLRPKLFEPFFTTKDVGEGTGLGLSLSYAIVNEHGGHIEVDSVYGEGATFRIILPVTVPVFDESVDVLVST